jgi:hypothetical protein
MGLGACVHFSVWRRQDVLRPAVKSFLATFENQQTPLGVAFLVRRKTRRGTPLFHQGRLQKKTRQGGSQKPVALDAKPMGRPRFKFKQAPDSPVFPHRRFWAASTSLSPFPLEKTGLSIVPPIRKGNCNLPSFNVAPESRAMVLVKKLSLVVISAKPR